MEQLVKQYRESHLGRRLPAYDGRKSLYTAGPLPFVTKDFKITLIDEDDGTGQPRYIILSFSLFYRCSCYSKQISFLTGLCLVALYIHILMRTFVLCRREREFKVVIKMAARADLHHLGLFLQGRQADAPQEALQVLDIVLRELPTTRYVTTYLLYIYIFKILGLCFETYASA